jgi:beta-glucosidase
MSVTQHHRALAPSPHVGSVLPVTPPPLELAVATSSYQIEGATAIDGRGPSIWDTFSAQPGRVVDGGDGSVACDSYRCWEDDLDLVAGLGVDQYRFSIAWPRVQPTGSGPVEPRGLDYYDRIVDGLLARGVAPNVTLYHWDLPQPLEDAGGWPARDTAARFAEYAAIVHERLGDRVTRWATLNEPWVAAFLGYAAGVHAPGRTEPDAAFRAAHHLLLAHAWGAQALRAADAAAEVGLVLNLTSVLVDDEEAFEAGEVIDAEHNEMWLRALRDGRYPEVLRGLTPVLHDPKIVRDGDLDAVQGSAAWLGINYYTPLRIASPDVEHPESHGGPGQETAAFPGAGPFVAAPRGSLTTMGWEVEPLALRDLLDRLHVWDPAMPLHITENGVALPDDVRAPDGFVDDPGRISYLQRHLAVVDTARERGVDLRTYTVWSLLDNFEWAMGYTQTFGLVEVDPLTGERRPKASYRWLAGEAERRRADAPSG